MKALFLVFFLFSMHSSFANEPDILVYSRVTKDWNVYLLDKFHIFMKNLRLNIDPYKYVHDASIAYDESSINDFVSNDVSSFIKSIEHASGLSILDLHPELTLSGFGYTINKIFPKIETDELNNNLALKSNISLQGVDSFAKELKLSFLISHLSDKGMISVLDVKIKKPKIKIKDSRALNFDLNLLLEENNNSTVMRFYDANFEALTKELANNQELIEITYEGVEIPPVELNLMGRSITVNAQKVKEIIENNKDKIKKILADQIVTLFEKNGALEILKHFDGYTFKNDRWILPTSESVFPMYLQIKDFFSPMENIVGVEMKGDFCDTKVYDVHKEDCVNKRKTLPAKSKITFSDAAYSKANLKEVLETDEDVMMIASISEDYINKALATTIDFGLWDEMLNKVGLKLGDQGVQVRLNKYGDTATLYMDVIYQATKMQKFFIKEENIRFPLSLDVKVRIENEEQLTFDEVTQSFTKSYIPFVVFNVFDVDLNDNNFKYGIEKYDLPTTISNVRKVFRNRVIKTIKKELLDYDAPEDIMTLLKWKGTDVPPVEMPEISGMDLDLVDTSSDGHGRLNIIMKSSKVLGGQ